MDLAEQEAANHQALETVSEIGDFATAKFPWKDRRPATMSQVLAHPFFWDDQQKLAKLKKTVPPHNLYFWSPRKCVQICAQLREALEYSEKDANNKFKVIDKEIAKRCKIRDNLYYQLTQLHGQADARELAAKEAGKTAEELRIEGESAQATVAVMEVMRNNNASVEDVKGVWVGADALWVSLKASGKVVLAEQVLRVMETALLKLAGKLVAALKAVEACELKAAQAKTKETAKQQSATGLKQNLEKSLCGKHGDFMQDAATWATFIPKPPGRAGNWNKPPKVWPAFPLFSLITFIRNAVGHLPQLLKEGLFADEVQMQTFFIVENFPWLPSVLSEFVHGPLKQIVKKESLDTGLRAALQPILDLAGADDRPTSRGGLG